MRPLDKKSTGLILGLSLAVLFLISLLIKFETSLTGPGRFVAVSEWTLIQIEQDKVQSNLLFNGIEQKNEISLFHFNRPDYIQLSLKPGLKVGERVQAGDLIASVASYEDEFRLASLQGDLQRAKANLSALSTGAKTAEQEEMSRALEYAKAQLEAYKPVLQRQKELYDKKVVSKQQLELAQAQYDLYQIEVELQQARLKATETGEKQEALEILQAQINSISDQLDILNKKAEAESIRSPINGIVVQPDRSLGEIFHVCNTDTMIVQMPVRDTDIQSVQSGMVLKASARGASEQIRSTVSGISHNASLINMQPMFMVTAELDNQNHNLIHGMSGVMEISTGSAYWWQLLQEAWTNFRFNK